MDIAKYTAYFHDGDLVDIIQKGDSIEFLLISAELPENLHCEIPMTHQDRLIRGILRVSEVIEISINGKTITGPLRMKYDEGDLFDFEIKEGVVEFVIIWSNFRPRLIEKGTDTIKVQGKGMQWIPKLDLVNPMDLIEPPPGRSGHRVGPHYHLLNPNATNRNNKYFDENRSPVAQGSKDSRLKPPERYSGNAFPAETSPLVDDPIKFIKYAGYFHDGSLIGLLHIGNQLKLTLISAEINEQDRFDDIPLSRDFRLKGVLILEGVSNLKVNEKPFNEPLKMESEIADIYNLEISEHALEMNLTWETYTPCFSEVMSQTVGLNFDRLHWENDPSLE